MTDDGTPYRAPSTPDEWRREKLDLCERAWKKRAIATGQPIAPRAERVRVDELLDDLITEYKTNRRRSLRRTEISVAHVRDYFGGHRAQMLDTAHVREYIATRQAEKASNGTINRELAALKRAFTLGCQARKILTRPHIPALVEDNARQGFFERDQFESVRASLPAELEALLKAQRAHTDDVSKKTGRIITHVFHRDGTPIRDFRGAWRNACQAAGFAATVEQPDGTKLVRPASYPARLPPHGRPQPRARRRPPQRRDADGRAQDGGDLSPLRDRGDRE